MSPFVDMVGSTSGSLAEDLCGQRVLLFLERHLLAWPSEAAFQDRDHSWLLNFLCEQGDLYRVPASLWALPGHRCLCNLVKAPGPKSGMCHPLWIVFTC